jgi:hypothetical protein
MVVTLQLNPKLSKMVVQMFVHGLPPLPACKSAKHGVWKPANPPGPAIIKLTDHIREFCSFFFKNTLIFYDKIGCGR